MTKNNNNNTDDGVSKKGNASKKRRIISQEDKQLAEKRTKQAVELAYCVHMLKMLTDPSRRELWQRDDFKEVRECIAVIKSDPENYPPLHGDNIPDHTTSRNSETSAHNNPPLTLTSDCISRIANYQSFPEDSRPILQVAADPVMKFEESKHNNKSNHTHITHLRLCDGNKDVMIGRLSMHIAHDGKKLGAGDIIQLESFTPLTYTPSRTSNNPQPHKSPAVVIHTYSIIGYKAVPIQLNDPLPCITMTDEQIEEYTINELTGGSVGDDEYEELVEVDCTAEHRYCSMYGVSTVVCVCKTDPVEKINLNTVREYCYFATYEIEKMPNSKKRNMLYWWYMTNIYGICGKGNRKDPPACLKAAIRKAYPDPNGKYKPYNDGKKKSK